MELAHAIDDVIEQFEDKDSPGHHEATIRISVERLDGSFASSVILSTARRRLVARGRGVTLQQALDRASQRLTRRLAG